MHRSLYINSFKFVWRRNAAVTNYDEIISYGGTMYYSADALHKLNAKSIYAYATHVESDSLWDKKGTFKKALGFEDDEMSNYPIVKRLYTTDSLYKYDSEKRVYVVKLENEFNFNIN